MNNIIVKENEEIVIDLTEFESVSFTVNRGGKLTINCSCFDLTKKETLIKGTVEENGSFEGHFADFSSGDFTVNSSIELIGKKAKATWDLASLSTNKDNKVFNISFLHKVGETYSLMNNYGVTRDNSRLVFSGTNHIYNNCKKASTSQNAKIIVFDEGSKGKANPILRIDENDVFASHSAIVGRLNDDHLFYLKSRGLSENQAKALIIEGYLKPIAKYFSKDIEEKIVNSIKEKCRV